MRVCVCCAQDLNIFKIFSLKVISLMVEYI